MRIFRSLDTATFLIFPSLEGVGTGLTKSEGFSNELACLNFVALNGELLYKLRKKPNLRALWNKFCSKRSNSIIDFELHEKSMVKSSMKTRAINFKVKNIEK
uniref:Uncharacterized protein n=1 Tax=Romanomermis culicivorax TaxID=13658 RepID=A0A915IGH7_ROMCU